MPSYAKIARLQDNSPLNEIKLPLPSAPEVETSTHAAHLSTAQSLTTQQVFPISRSPTAVSAVAGTGFQLLLELSFYDKSS